MLRLNIKKGIKLMQVEEFQLIVDAVEISEMKRKRCLFGTSSSRSLASAQFISAEKAPYARDESGGRGVAVVPA